jgi:hypothetical protein
MQRLTVLLIFLRSFFGFVLKAQTSLFYFRWDTRTVDTEISLSLVESRVVSIYVTDIHSSQLIFDLN